MSRMYKETQTFNPAVGCKYGCVYCKPSFQAILKRFHGKKCKGCKDFTPHYHPERLNKIPTNKENLLLFGTGDITFYKEDFVIKTLKLVNEKLEKYSDITLYLQSKNPIIFNKYLPYLVEDRTVLLTTLETNRDYNYFTFSKAPMPSVRAKDFNSLDFDHKIITIEPVMDFDLIPFFNMIQDINPERIYLGLNSRPKQVLLPEPSHLKFINFYLVLKDISGYDVVLKNIDRLKGFVK